MKTERHGYSNRDERRTKAAQKARLAAISEGLQAEVYAFNEALRAGKEVLFPVREGSLASGLVVKRARYGWDGLWVETANYGGSFALGNDERWSTLLMLAGVARDPRTA